MQIELTLPLPRLRAELAVAPLAEASAVLAKLRFGQVVDRVMGVVIGAQPAQALRVGEVEVPHRTVEPEQIESGFGHGQSRALNAQTDIFQIAVDVLVRQLQVGAELAALVAPQHAVGAQAQLIGDAGAVQGRAGQFERRTILGVAGERAVGPVAVGNRVIQAGVATVAVALIQRVAGAEAQQVVELQRTVEAQADAVAIPPGAGAAEVVHAQPQRPARLSGSARAQDDSRRARLAAGGDVGGQVKRAQAVQLIEALLQIAQVQRLAEHVRERAAQRNGQALIGQFDRLDVAFVHHDVQRLPRRRRTQQVRAAGDVALLDIDRGDSRQQMIDLADAHARRQQRFDPRVELVAVEQRNAADTRAAQWPAAFIGGDGLRDGRCGRCRTERTALQLALALFHLQLLQIALLLLLLAQHFLAGATESAA